MGSTQAGSLIWIVLLFGMMYFLMIRPQQTQQKKRREMLSALRKGDRIATVGGIFGTILEVRDDTVLLRIADKVDIELSKNGVGAVVKSKAESRAEIQRELEKEVKKEKGKKEKVEEPEDSTTAQNEPGEPGA